MFRVLATTDKGSVDIHDPTIVAAVAKLLAEIATDAARAANGEPAGKRIGRPPKSSPIPASTTNGDAFAPGETQAS